MRSGYLSNLTYRDRGIPLFGTLFAGVFCDAALMAMVFLAQIPAEPRRLLAMLACFLLPFLIFAAGGAALADRIPKRGAVILGKTVELATMIFSVFAFQRGGMNLIFCCVFLAGMTAAILLPAYSGILHETFSEKKLSRAVGDSMCAGFLAGICGVAAVFFFDGMIFRNTAGSGSFAHGTPALTASILLASVSFLGLVLSYRIYPTAVEAGRKEREQRFKVFSLTDGIRELTSSKSVIVANLGVLLFFLLFAFIEILLLCLFQESPRWPELSDSGVSDLCKALFPGFVFAFALACGFSICGRLSGGKVECGLVPFGAVGLAVFLPLAAWQPGPLLSVDGFFNVSWVPEGVGGSFQWRPLQILWLLFAGLSAGLIPVPLRTFLHTAFSPAARGAAFATFNALLFLLLSLLFLREDLLRGMMRSGGNLHNWLALCGFVPLAATTVAGFFLPWLVIRSAAVLLTHTFYKLSVKGAENIPDKGGALLISNHTSYADSLLILSCSSRQIRFLIHEKFYRNPFIHPFAKMIGSIEVPSRGEHRIERMLEEIRGSLRAGRVVCVFPEGKVSRNGVMGDFKAGYAKMLPDDCEIPMIPVSVGLVWGSLFSNYSGKSFCFSHPARISIGSPLNRTEVDTAFCLRQAISELETEASMKPLKKERTLHYQFAKNAKHHPFRTLFCQQGGEDVPMFRTLISAILLSREIRKLAGDSKYVGLMLPNSVTLVTGILAVLFADKVPAPLNYTASKDTLRKSLDKADITLVLTDRKFLEKVRVEPVPEMVMLDDVLAGISGSSKILWTLAALFLPHQELMTYVSPSSHREVESPAVLLFSSGSTGEPKGVLLSHHNINADIRTFIHVLNWTEKDRILGNLPLFHSFGLTTCLWIPVLAGCRVVYVASPLECSAVQDAVMKHKVSIILATPTFMAAYLRRCAKETFRSVRLVIVGAEKMRKDIAAKYEEVTEGKSLLLEAYGCTETSPVVTVNIGSDLLEPGKECGKLGSIGVAIPGVSVKIVDPVTREELPPGMDGLLLVKGPNIMLGYLKDAVRTANVISDGWYETGDVGHMDQSGYVSLSGRISRFSKIAGEMVPHELLECIMGEIIGKDERVFAIGGIPDRTKGEALVVIYLKEKMDISPEEMNDALRKHNIPNLWIPRTANYLAVDELPVTGTGKLDLVKLNDFIKKQFKV